MSDCEWDDPHDGYARFCLTHECWITAPVTVTTCPISDLLGKVQRVQDIELVFPPDDAPPWVHGEAKGWNKALGEVRRALDGVSSGTKKV